MTTKPKARKFRIKRSAGPASDGRDAPEQAQQPDDQPTARSGQVDSAETVATEGDMDAIRKEGLTGRQLRMARRVAQKQGLAVTSDFDAVRQLRARGIDPFQRANILELVVPDDGTAPGAGPGMDASAAGGGQGNGGGRAGVPQKSGDGQGRVQLPQTIQKKQMLPSTERANPAEQRAGEIMKIQRDIARRRRKSLVMLFSRLGMFVLLPTFAAAWYFYVVATPMFATKAEFVIQQAEPQGAGGLGGLFQGTGMATQQDSTTVQSYLTSRAAMVRLDQDHGFIEHFSDPDIDAIQRLPEGATNEDAYGLYQSHVKIGYDPTEGILKMEVIAASPEASQEFSNALIKYAEEQVDQLTQRLREDQMSGALASYEASEARRAEALAELSRIQGETTTLDPLAAAAALQQRITTLEIELDAKSIELASMLDNRRPNEARVNALRAEVDRLNEQIEILRSQLTEASGDTASLSSVTARLREAEENYNFQTVLVQQALAQMESARIEANRQVRYLSLGVEPIAPDEATYPKAFENTVLAFLIFSGIYLMISLTTSILREQVSS
ncbi:capsule biosynthesis protein [Octadecabacter sp. R77987]|uniref:capsule biosynthesis protein n=1 Tax=Octadecabacter sp. R77987 TaxID=3093874 RepID=UPI00366D4D6A